MDHYFRTSASHPLTLKEAKVYEYERGGELRCSVCRGRIRNEHEFFRCADCSDEFIMVSIKATNLIEICNLITLIV